MIDNPFLSNTYKTIWLRYFSPNKKTYLFNSLPDVTFLKHKRFPIFYNVGKNITNGMSYTLSDLEKNKDFKKRVFLIYDVPDYFDVETDTQNTSLKISKVRQYKGLLEDLNAFDSFDNLFLNIRSKRRGGLRKKKEQLEHCFNITYKHYCGEIDKEEYDKKMLVFKDLIAKRFGDLGLDNDILNDWEYYDELIYKMIIEKKALLSTVEDNDVPIAISFSFLSDNILFYSTPTFDIDYLKFNLGHTSIIELLKWCFDNNFTTFDFSKGEYVYKRRWANKEYNFNHHVIYDSSSIIALMFGVYLTNYFKFKQYLRDKKVNFMYSKFKYVLKNKKTEKENIAQYRVEELDEQANLDSYNLIDIYSNSYSFLKSTVFDCLSSNPEPINGVKIYANDQENMFLVNGKLNKYKILLSS